MKVNLSGTINTGYYDGCEINFTEMIELAPPLGKWYYTSDIPNMYTESFDMWFSEKEIDFD